MWLALAAAAGALVLAGVGILLAIWTAERLYGVAFPQRLEGKHVLITGGGNGLGQTLAMDMVAEGASVVVWDTDQRGLQETVRLVNARSPSGSITAVCVDVTSRQQVLLAANRTGPVDILVNNAGVGSSASILELQEDTVRKVIDTNCVSHFWTIQAFLPAMIERNSGHIVTISSIAAFQGVAFLSPYSVSKCGTLGFAECLRQELYASGATAVNTTVVCPYLLTTKMFRGVQPPWLGRLITGPPLTPQRVSKRTVQAIKWREQVVSMPAYMPLMHIMRVLPTSFMDCLSRSVGAATAMYSLSQGKDLNSKRAR